MAIYNVPQNTTAIDVAFNLSGSLTGFPAVLAQLPTGKRVGFATLPTPWQDVDDIGQTWTPDIQGMQLDLVLPIYNQQAVDKAPYTTDLFGLNAVVAYGEEELRKLLGATSMAWYVTMRKEVVDETTGEVIVYNYGISEMSQDEAKERAKEYASMVEYGMTSQQIDNLLNSI